MIPPASPTEDSGRVRRQVRSLFAICAVMAITPMVGCGGVPAPPLPPLLPHQGVVVALPDERGFAEILNEGQARGKPAGRRSLVAVVHFYSSDRQSPLVPAPTEVSLTINGAKVLLVAAPDPKDTKAGARFASAPGPYELREAKLEVSANLGDKSFSELTRGPR